LRNYWLDLKDMKLDIPLDLVGRQSKEYGSIYFLEVTCSKLDCLEVETWAKPQEWLGSANRMYLPARPEDQDAVRGALVHLIHLCANSRSSPSKSMDATGWRPNIYVVPNDGGRAKLRPD
jgi:hypothetical protein